MKLSLQAKLIGAALMVTIIVAAVLTFLAVNQQISSNQNSLSSEVDAQSGAFTRYLSTWAKDRTLSMAAMRRAMETHYVENGNKIDHQEALKILNQGKASVGFGMSFIGMEDGTMYRHDPQLDKNKPNYDPRVRGWYKGAKKSLKPFVSKPYIAVTGKKLAITFVEPVIINGEYLGAIGGLVYLEEILTDVLDLKVKGDGYAVILDKSDVIAAHPDKELILKPAADLGDAFAMAQFNNADNFNQLMDVSVLGQNTVIYANEVPGTNWILLLTMQKDVLNEPVNGLLTKVLFVVAVLLVLAALGVTAMIRWLFADLKQVSEGLDNIARGNGDLTQRINTKSNDEIGRLANSFNSFVSHLHDIIANVNDVGVELGEQAQQVADQAKTRAQNVKTQEDEMALVAGSVTQMSEATRDIAESATSASGVADVAVSISSEGQTQVRKSQDSINALADEVSQASSVILELDNHVQEIGSILTTISGIAEQTNLLALNAAIEAARAGEQGRGFAVVADEVRVLSQRTHSSTEEIQKMIDVLQTTAQNAVNSMESSKTLAETSVGDAETASESLEKIRTEITRINEMVTGIASAADQQTTVAAEVNKNAGNIHAANQKLSTDVEGSLNRSNHLKGLTEKLKSDLQQFKL